MRYFAQEDAVFMRRMGIDTALSTDAGFHVIQFGSSYLFIKEKCKCLLAIWTTC
jgi:hypothetical protein